MKTKKEYFDGYGSEWQSVTCNSDIRHLLKFFKGKRPRQYSDFLRAGQLGFVSLDEVTFACSHRVYISPAMRLELIPIFPLVTSRQWRTEEGSNLSPRILRF
jgi:hypothetical protein